MLSDPDGRAANQPLAAIIFKPPIGAWLPGALVSFTVIGSPASVDAVTASGESFANFAFCSGVAGASAVLVASCHFTQPIQPAENA